MAQQRIFLADILDAIERAFITPPRNRLPVRQSAAHRAEFVNALKTAIPVEAFFRGEQPCLVLIRVAAGDDIVDVHQGDDGRWVARLKRQRGRPRKGKAEVLRPMYQKLLPSAQLVSKYLRTPETAPALTARDRLIPAREYLARMATSLSHIPWLPYLRLVEDRQGAVILMFSTGDSVRPVMPWADFVSRIAPSKMLEHVLGAAHDLSPATVHVLVGTRPRSIKNRK